jgi:uncharacterized protein YjbI with pentapeptide repeats
MADPDHLARLLDGAANWNAWRLTEPDADPDLSDANFVNQTFNGLDLRGANLHGLDARGAELTDCDLRGAYIYKAQFDNARFTRCNLSDTNVGKTSFDAAILTDVDAVALAAVTCSMRETVAHRVRLRSSRFDHVDLTGAKFDETDLRQASFGMEIVLRGATFAASDLTETNLEGCDAEDATFSACHLRRANLQYAQLRRSRISNCDASAAQFTEASLDETVVEDTCFDDSTFHKASLWSAKCTRSSFLRADLTEADLSSADFTGATMTAARLGESSMSETQFVDADLTRADMSDISEGWRTNFTGAILQKAELTGGDFNHSSFTRARLTGAALGDANLTYADFTDADLAHAFLHRANLSNAKFVRANLHASILEESLMIKTNFEGADISGSRVFGVSAWDLNLTEATQSNLGIMPLMRMAPTIEVDSLEVAQFLYLLLRNEKLRTVIDSITAKVVLILGRFTDERKPILDAIRVRLRESNYLPILFDFEKPASRDLTETVSTLAHMARFVIADITEARSIPQELSHIAPLLVSVPIQPLLQAGATEYAMFEHWRRFPAVLEVYRYTNEQGLLDDLEGRVILPAEQKREELLRR